MVYIASNVVEQYREKLFLQLQSTLHNMKQDQGNDIITLMPSLPGLLSGKQNSNWTPLRGNQGVKSQNIQMAHTTLYLKKNNKKWT